ncbi:MAG: hypothetical protein AB7I18_04685 [Candidatus Berkiella sp.]
MPKNNIVETPPFTEEEKEKYSPILKLRKSDNQHFRREFQALGTDQARFMEYINMKESQAENEDASKSGAAILNGFRLSEAPQPVQPQASKVKKKRCILL